MDLKFYLNKIVKVDNIEGYTLKSINKIKDSYNEFLEKTDGKDPDYPGYSFGNKSSKGTKLSVGQNVYQLMEGM